MGIIKSWHIHPIDTESFRDRGTEIIHRALTEISYWLFDLTGVRLNLAYPTSQITSTKDSSFFFPNWWSSAMWSAHHEGGQESWQDGIINLIFIAGDDGTGTGGAQGGNEHPSRTGVAVVTGKAVGDLVTFPLEDKTSALHPRGVIAHELFHAIGIPDPYPNEPGNIMEHNETTTDGYFGWQLFPESTLNASQIEMFRKSIFCYPSLLPSTTVEELLIKMKALETKIQKAQEILRN